MRTFLKCILSVVVLLTLITGCQTTAPKIAPVCSLPSGNNLALAMEKSRERLALKHCQVIFEDYLEALMAIAEKNPDSSHRQAFSRFFSWAQAEDIISTNQAKELYSRYFVNTFVCLPDSYNTCSVVPTEAKLDRLLALMATELKDKERGMVKICGDRIDYQGVYDQYTALVTILDAACMACSQGGGA